MPQERQVHKHFIKSSMYDFGMMCYKNFGCEERQKSLMQIYTPDHTFNLKWSILHLVNLTFGQLLHLVNCYQTSTDTFHPNTFGPLIQTHINLVNLIYKVSTFIHIFRNCIW